MFKVKTINGPQNNTDYNTIFNSMYGLIVGPHVQLYVWGNASHVERLFIIQV